MTTLYVKLWLHNVKTKEAKEISNGHLGNSKMSQLNQVKESCRQVEKKPNAAIVTKLRPGILQTVSQWPVAGSDYTEI